MNLRELLKEIFWGLKIHWRFLKIQSKFMLLLYKDQKEGGEKGRQVKAKTKSKGENHGTDI